MRVAFTIDMPVKGWARARVTRTAGGLRFWDSQTGLKALIGWHARAAGIREPLAGPVTLVIRTFRGAAPRIEVEISDEDRELADTKTPDADNVAKLIGDALNGIAWHDDRQIATLQVLKRIDSA